MASLGDVGVAIPPFVSYLSNTLYDRVAVITTAGKNYGVTTNSITTSIRTSVRTFDSRIPGSGCTISVIPIQQPAIAAFFIKGAAEIDRIGTDGTGHINFYDKIDTNTAANFLYEIHIVGGAYAEVWTVTITSRIATVTKLVAGSRTRSFTFAVG